MITSRDLRVKLEKMMEFILRNYRPAKYDPKSAIDRAVYKEAKKIYEEADDALCSCDIEWIYHHNGDWVDNFNEDYDAIAELIDKLSCEIEMMEEDFGIEN